MNDEGSAISDRPAVSDWATDFDHLSNEWATRGPEILADLRERCPVAHTDRFHGAYLVTRYDDITEVARQTDTFSSRITLINDNHPDNVKLVLPPITLDPPDHGPIRRALLPSFNPSEMAALEPWVRDVTKRLLDDLIGRELVDGALDFGQLLPVEVMAHLFGVSSELGPTFRGWVNGMLKDGLVDLDIARRANREIQAYFAEQLAQRRLDPKDDLVTTVLNAEAHEPDGTTRPFTERERIGSLYLLMLGGIDTTWSSLGSILFHLATHPDDLARLAGSPELMPSAVEEFLRFYSPWRSPESSPTTPRSLAAPCRQASVSCCPTRPPTGTKPISTDRTRSFSIVRTTAMSRSASVCTAALAPTWPAWNYRSVSNSGSIGIQGSSWRSTRPRSCGLSVRYGGHAASRCGFSPNVQRSSTSGWSKSRVPRSRVATSRIC